MIRNSHPNRLSSLAQLPMRCGARLHRDEGGSISIISVFALMMLVVLLGMVMNSSRQVDQKVKMQNAADASTYAGGIVIVRGMNTLAFTNHLLSDVFAITAYFREARDRNAESLAPAILDNWERVSGGFIGSEFPKFDQLGSAIAEKVPRERKMVLTFSEWAYAASEIMLPVFEEILAERTIPEFQRALVDTTPELAQLAADEIAQRHGDAWPRPVELHAQLWRTSVDPVGGVDEEERRTLPVVDPVMDEHPDQLMYLDRAREQRDRLAHRYLRDWNNESLEPFDILGKMSQFSNLWRIFTCGQLKQLLEEEYPDTNMPFQIRHEVGDIASYNEHLGQDFMFVGVVYSEPMQERVPGIFRNPTSLDQQAYAQLMMFVPRRRLIKVYPSDNPSSSGNDSLGGIPGESIELPGPRGRPRPPRPPDGEEGDQEPDWFVTRQSGRWHNTAWNLLNQNWTLQLSPATSSSIPSILSSQPYVNGFPEYSLPDLSELTEDDLQWLSHH